MLVSLDVEQSQQLTLTPTQIVPLSSSAWMRCLACPELKLLRALSLSKAFRKCL